MSKTTGRNWPLRLACILPGLALVLWALSDGPMIGGAPGIRFFDGAVLGLGVITVIAGLMPKGFVANYLALFVMGMLTLVAAEVVLRSFFKGNYFAANHYDERVLFKLRPSFDSSFTHIPANGGETIVTRINSDGFAGPELIADDPRPRVMVYGDSFMNAVFTPEEDRFSTVLQAELSAALGREVEVINAGVAGYGPDQVLRRLETEIDAYQPDLVVFGLFTGNDFGDLLRNRLYRLDETGALVENDYILSAEQQRNIALNKHELVLLRVLKDAKKKFAGPSGHFAAFDPEAWMKQAYDQHLREYNEFVVQGDNTVGAFAVDPYSTDIATDPDSPSSQYKLRMMDAVVARIAQETLDAGVPLLAVAVPHPMDLLGGAHASGKINRDVFPNYNPTELTDAATAIFDRNDIANVNLYAPMAAEDVSALYLGGGDDHWNAAGQALGARVVAEQIMAEGLLD